MARQPTREPNMKHTPHSRIEERKKHGVPTTAKEHTGFNGWLAVKITNGVGTMWCAYAFTVLTLVSLPDAIKGGTATLISWIAQTFLQLVLLSIIMVGQKVAAAASDKQAYQTYKDAEALLTISNDLHQLLKLNNQMTDDIHKIMNKKTPG
jgi:ABC-type nickel/cobalt efflux system permease component RcnA